jgi:hypothetical protein
MSRVYEGGCFCGAVRYRATGAPYNVTHCHCTICRRLSAAPFVTWATFRSADFAVVGGAPAHIASSVRAERTFCGRCGTPLTFQLHASPDELDVTVCSLDDPEGVVPEDHTQAATALSWVRLADGLPRHDTERPPARA